VAEVGKSEISIEEALAEFANGESPEVRRSALSTLIASKYLPKQADSQQVAIGRDRLLQDAAGGADQGRQLLAIAEVIRLSQVVKRWQPQIKKGLESAFNAEIPAMSLLPEADDRLNVARACAQFDSTWLPGYLAKAIAEEEQGEKARTELIATYLTKHASLASAFRTLTPQFQNLRPGTEEPGDSIAKRLTRTLAALRVAVIESELDAGDDLGKAINDFLALPLSSVGKPQDDKTKIELIREAVLTVHDLVRTRISVVADPAMYLIVGYCRRLLGGSTWPDELRKPLDRLISNVCEALVLLGRQGRCDQGLLEQLDVLCNYPERARVLAKDLVTKHPELPEEVRDWLARGRARPTREARSTALEIASSSADASIGLALQSARQARQMSTGLRDQLISSLEIYEPMLASATSECLNRTIALAVQVEQVANLRRVALFGTIGEEVDVSTKFFELVGEKPRQRMVVKQPAVVRMRDDGTPGDVILKGLVD